MTLVVCLALTLVLLAAVAVVFTDQPDRQAVTLSALGVALTVLFMTLEAPDVALSQLAVGAAVVPLLVMLTISKIRSGR